MSASGKTTSTTRVRSADFLRVLGGGSYTISAQSAIEGKTIDASVSFYAGNAESDYSNRISVISFSAAPLNFTVPSNANFAVFTFAYSNNSDITPTGIKEIQLEAGSTASAYVPYSGTSYPVSWQSSAGTVYGGTLDVVSGLLTVTMASVDLGTLNYGYESTLMRFNATVLGMKTMRQRRMPLLSDIYKTISDGSAFNSAWDNVIYNNDNINQIVIHNHAYTDPATFKTAMNGHSVVYELAAPVTYQLTPTEVDSLLGANNLWHDANGNIEANYYADTTLFINKKIAAAIASLS
jgi:hypothetical protein